MRDDIHPVKTSGEATAGRLADRILVSRGLPFRESFPAGTLVKVAILAALFAAMNCWHLPSLVRKWYDEPNWSHGFLIPLFSIYLLYVRWEDLCAARRTTCLWGLPVMILGILLVLIGYYPPVPIWASQVAMPVVLFGLVLYLGGPRIIRITWLPILYLALAMPIPDRLYRLISVPLQDYAAMGSASILQLFGVDITVTASHLRIVSTSGIVHPLVVEEACSGVRSLMAYVALGVAWAYLEQRPIWQRLILVASTVPIAVLCNVLRVTITCQMYVIDRPELGQGFMHEFAGMLMLIPAVILFWLLGLLMQKLFVEVDTEPDRSGRTAEAPRA